MREMKIKNLTNHNIDLLLGRAVRTIEPSGEVARVDHRKHPCGQITVDGEAISVTDYSRGEIVNLPDPEPGVLLVCSTHVGQHPDVRGKRTDVVCPDTYNALRNTGRQVVAICGFVRYV